MIRNALEPFSQKNHCLSVNIKSDYHVPAVFEHRGFFSITNANRNSYSHGANIILVKDIK